MDPSNLDNTVGRNQNRYSFMSTPREMNPPSQFPSPTLPQANSRGLAEDPPQQQDTWSPTPNEKAQFHDQGILPDYANCPPPEQHPANYAPFADTSAQHQSTQLSSYSTAHGTQQQDAPIVTQYATAYGNPNYTTQPASQPYTNQSYSNQPQHTVSPHPYTSQSYANIPLQQGTMPRQGYVDTSGYHCATPVSAHPYAYSHTQSYTTMPDQVPRSTQITPQPYTYNEQPVSTPISPGPLPLKIHTGAPRSNTVNIAPDENPLQSPAQTYFPPPTRAATAPEDLSAFHHPGQTVHPNQEAAGGGWSNGLCELSNFGICCLGLICPCILYGRTQHRLSMKSRKEDPTNMLGYENCNGSCTGMGLLCGCQWLMATIQHTRTRKAYGIEGSVASDCVRASCCTCCTLIQDEKEIQKREEVRARAARARGAALLSPYTTPGPMSYGRSD